jgi:RNA polymerase sigma-70 factor, ECF subfamily
MAGDEEARDDERRERFVALYRACYEPIYAYVRRRVESGAEVPDVVAEVFAVAWRRIDTVPAAPEDRLWLYGVARHSLHRARRGASRRRRLHARLIEEARVGPSPAAPRDDHASQEVLSALGRLRPIDQEVVRLLLWEQLSQADAARVLGCSVNAVALRFRKAKARLREELGPTSMLAALPLQREDSTLPARS